MTTELILIRHGHAHRVNGDYFHAPLTSIGQEQAVKTAHFFNEPHNHLEALYSSPLLRSWQTAGIIGAMIGLEAKPRPGIQEVDLSEAIFLTLLELLSFTRPLDNYLASRAGASIHWPVEGRVSRVLLDILDHHPGQRVGVVVHAGVISGCLSWYQPARRWHWWRTTVSNCSLTRFSVEAGHGALLAVNEINHLTPPIISTQPPASAVQVAQQVHPPAMPGQVPDQPEKDPPSQQDRDPSFD